MNYFEGYVKNTKLWYEQERNGIIIIACGITILIVILITQYVSIGSLLSRPNSYDNYRISINEEQIKSLNDIALPTLIIFLVGLTLAIIGFRLILKTWMNEYLNDMCFFKQSTRNTVFSKMQMHLSKQICLISSIGYFIIISLLSSTIIYRPFLSFSQLYHIVIPSWHIIGCCGLPGTYPVLTVYFTNQFGILLVPLNLILSSFLSLLVGVNILLLIYKIKKNNSKIKREKLPFCNIYSKRNSTFLSIGAIVGLFVECPACAGSLIFYLIGANLTVAGGIATTTIVTEIQPFFIAASFILLLIPLLIIRKGMN